MLGDCVVGVGTTFIIGAIVGDAEPAGIRGNTGIPDEGLGKLLSGGLTGGGTGGRYLRLQYLADVSCSSTTSASLQRCRKAALSFRRFRRCQLCFVCCVCGRKLFLTLLCFFCVNVAPVFTNPAARFFFMTLSPPFFDSFSMELEFDPLCC